MSSVADLPNEHPALTRASKLSRYVRDLLCANPALPSSVPLDRQLGVDWMRAQLAGQYDDERTLRAGLRRLRKAVMLNVITRDLDGRSSLVEVVATVTALAELSLAAAVSHHSRWLAQEFGNPSGNAPGATQQLHV